MAKQQKCRDCNECRRTGLGKLLRGSVRLGAAVTTLGTTEVVNRVQKTLIADVCPICNHRMSLHTNKDSAVAE